MLYTGNTVATVAIECGVLRADARDHYTWATDLAEQYRADNPEIEAITPPTA